ncbi:DEAD/DEAH box helicase [Pseudonocardia humida]|uniref:RNA helicase n=1 Tax=Pseudonocardia humida TaxID=2800819 RepID=A0ABT1A3S4_9PSEU|nr:DEAD/DEAH box helicase [Pseudonocardia humida]MCO1657509.1 DEAD/DEAH box helicase [Pseudonocardia humida]
MVRTAPRRFSRQARSRDGRWSEEPAPAPARREAIILSVENDTPENPDSSDNSTEAGPAAGEAATAADAAAVDPTVDAAPADDVVEAHPLQAGAPVREDSPTFAELGVRPEIVRALSEAGIVRTFAIQELTLPLALAGDDIIGQARTGMGKTLGFGVPLLQRVVPPSEQPAANAEGEAADRTKDVPQALVVVPTRELCVQVAKDIADAGKHLGIRVTAIYGGRAYEPQLAALRKGVDVVVGTPGRLLDLAEQRHLVLGRVKALVLDEADEMLDLGFLPDVERIMRMLPEQRHTMLFSATMPGPIIALSRAFLTQPTHIRAEESDQGSIHERTRQLVYRAHAMDKVELLTRVLQADGRGLTMIFARTKRTVQRVADDLADRGFAAAAVHGDLGQSAREQALRAFRSGKIDVLVATDVAARGIDVTDVTHVINYQCPEDSKTYVHRIGRTGRAGKEGVAVTLVDWDEMPRWKMVSDDLNLGIDEPVETYSTSDHLYADLAIPTSASGRLPRSKRTRAGLDAEYVDPELDHGGRKRADKRTGRDRKRPEDEVVAPRRPRADRTRTRSRAGVTVAGAEGGEPASGSDTVTAEAAPAAPAGTDGPDTSTTNGSNPRPDGSRPRRRRRRGGRGRSGAGESATQADTGPDAAAS